MKEESKDGFFARQNRVFHNKGAYTFDLLLSNQNDRRLNVAFFACQAEEIPSGWQIIYV